MIEFRADVGTIGRATRLPDGRLRSSALITKPGVFEYLDANYPGGIRRELRLEEEVFSKETMDSMAAMPITRGHPPKLLTADTAKIYMVGSTGERASRVRVDGADDHVSMGVMVADSVTIGRMDQDGGACSVGYYCTVDKTPGVHPKYGPYHVVQRNIRGNHLAVGIGSARAGEFARVRMDSSTYDETCARFDGARMDLSSGRLTSETDGHQHLVRLTDWDGSYVNSGETSHATMNGEGEQHSHPWVRGLDGVITIGESAGHTHTLLPEPSLVRADETDASKDGMVPAPRASNPAGGLMDPEKLKEMIKTLEAELRKLEGDKAETEKRADAAEKQRDIAQGLVAQHEKQIASLQTQIAANQVAIETVAITQATERADAAEAALATMRANRDKEIRQRCDLLAQATLVMGAEFRADALSDDQIRRACVKRMDASADISDAIASGVIDGQFQALMKRRTARAREDAAVSTILGTEATQKRQDSRSEKWEEYRNMGKRPLSEVINNPNRNRHTQKGT